MGRPKKFTRSEALSKAMELFRKQGYHATSIDDLVHELGINRASLYEAYGGKRELFGEALRLYIEKNWQELQTFLAGQKNIHEGLHTLFLNTLKAMQVNNVAVGCLVANTTTELLPHDQEVVIDLTKNRRRVEEALRSFIQGGIDRGEIAPKKNAVAIAHFLFAFSTGLSVLAKLQIDKAALITTIDEALKVLE